MSTEESGPKAQGFLAGIGVKIITHPQVQEALQTLLIKLLDSEPAQRTIDRQADRAIEKFLAVLPLTAATLGKTAIDHVLKGDPDIPVLSNVFDLSEQIRNGINNATPPGFNIGPLTDVMKQFGL